MGVYRLFVGGEVRGSGGLVAEEKLMRGRPLGLGVALTGGLHMLDSCHQPSTPIPPCPSPHAQGVLALSVPVPGLRRHLLLTQTLEWNLYW